MTTELATVDGVIEEPTAPITLFGTDDPVAVVERASVIATALADVIRRKQLYKHIGQSDHVFVEGWTLLGSMLGVFAEVEWSRPLTVGDWEGWESRAVTRTLSGRVVGAAEAMCSRREGKWRNADDYAMRSMAQTRAVSKALRLPLGFIMELAGYSATPAEELTSRPTPDDDGLPPMAANDPSDAGAREGPGEPGTTGTHTQPGEVPTSAEAGAGGGAPSLAPAPTDIQARYVWADRLGWDALRLDEAAVDATGQTVMEMDSPQWQAFALTLKAGALDPPPKPGTDGYKRLQPTDKAKARAYWQKAGAA